MPLVLCQAIPRGIFWVNPKTKEVTVFGSGDQRVSMSSIDMVRKATVAVLKNPGAFANRPAYFADYTISSNELLTILNELEGAEKWKPNQIPLTGFFQQAKQLWDADTANGVQDRLNSTAYQMLGTYGLFDESNRYGADFSGKIEEGFGVSLDEFKEILRTAIA
ncbi:hypothetical protein VTN77DRAFT_6953 [Rasamsonia byssochlamydoides]|uniref:uncharacterized protein n=1 Tax=Rasamsonia byssochlamydoides TaxID=89139 RepID=UPI00374232EA